MDPGGRSNGGIINWSYAPSFGQLVQMRNDALRLSSSVLAFVQKNRLEVWEQGRNYSDNEGSVEFHHQYYFLKSISQQQQQTQDGPTRDAGGWVDADKLYDFLLDQARNNSVEVAAYELKRGKEATKYFVLPWKENEKSNSVLPIGSLGKYIPGYSYKDITGVFHTHPRSTPPGSADRAFSDKYDLPIYSIGANGTSYLYLGGTTSPIDLRLYFGF